MTGDIPREAIRLLKERLGFKSFARILARVPPSYADALKTLAAESGVPAAQLVREGIALVLRAHGVEPSATAQLALDLSSVHRRAEAALVPADADLVPPSPGSPGGPGDPGGPGGPRDGIPLSTTVVHAPVLDAGIIQEATLHHSATGPASGQSAPPATPSEMPNKEGM